MDSDGQEVTEPNTDGEAWIKSRTTTDKDRAATEGLADFLCHQAAGRSELKERPGKRLAFDFARHAICEQSENSRDAK